MIKINYVSEINLPSKSGYAQHVLKICDAFSKKYKTKLFVTSSRISFKTIKKNYLLKTNFQINHYKKKSYNNFLFRILYVFFILKNIDKESIIISRSILSSLVLSVMKIKNIIELHHPPTGLTKVIFFIINFFSKGRYLKYIFLHNNIKKEMNIKNGIVLDDCVDINDFKKRNLKEKYEYCYVGSLFNGKGLEIIIQLALFFKKKKFHVFGDVNSIDARYFDIKEIMRIPNLYLHNFRNYNEITKILISSKFLLMPYLKNISVNSKNLEVSNYMSPLKMFDYLASGKIIFASNLKVYSHILKHKYNCLIVNKNNFQSWFSSLKKYSKKNSCSYLLSKNAKNTASKYTWDKRIIKIIKYYNNNQNV
jgi:hypothetical protein